MKEDERPRRKCARLQGYDYRTTGLYFVTICTQNRACTLGRIRTRTAARMPGPYPMPETHVGADARIGPLPDPAFVELSAWGKVVDRILAQMPGMVTYVVMPNHIHFLLCIPGEAHGPMQASAPTEVTGNGKPANLSQQVRIFKARVTRATGHSLFQRSFYDHIVRKDEEYQTIWQYIRYNPQRWYDDRFYSKGE